MLGIKSLMESVNLPQIEDIETSPTDVDRPELPQKTTLVTEKASKRTPIISNLEFTMPDMHICTIKEQESQESWISLMMDNDELMFWLNTLETLEETDLVPSELKM